nr:MAG TPA: hypothetical protein [Caudoviricetes sp.]
MHCHFLYAHRDFIHSHPPLCISNMNYSCFLSQYTL